MTPFLLFVATMIHLPSGTYQPLYGQAGERVRVSGFQMDRQEVTQREYLDFVRRYPQWQRSQVKKIYADENYLGNWAGDTKLGGQNPGAPVTEISWFAARAYCTSLGKRLPTVAEWEFAASASQTKPDATRDRQFLNTVLAQYMNRSSSPGTANGGRTNYYGLRGMHDRMWEWVEDYKSVMGTGDLHATGAKTHEMNCAAGASGATNTDNYPAFLRYAIRSGATSRTTMSTLGFRCAL